MKQFRLGLTYDDVLLVPQRSSLRSRHDADTSTNISKLIKLKIPIISANTDTVTESEMAIAMAKAGGIGIIHRFMTIKDQVDEVRTVKKEKVINPNLETIDGKGKLKVGGAVGVVDDCMERATALIKVGVDFILVDIAHGHAEHTIKAVEEIRSKFPQIEIMAGNVATTQGVVDLIKAGANSIKVGIGPGSVCKTRLVTGCGVPQLTAILDCVEAAEHYNVPIIADGGIKYSGDITKALSAGASAVMLARLLQGTEESASLPIIKDDRKYKISRGVATIGAKLARSIASGKELNKNDIVDYVPEGVESMVPYQGTTKEVLNQLVGGLRSGMSYCGARTLEELKNNAEFIQVTPLSLIESAPRVGLG